MRRFVFLPIFLLFQIHFLFSQVNCEIFNLKAQIVDQSPNSCQYWVKIEFDHTGTTNQFGVVGNGNNYGNFQYNQLPVVLGPFTQGAQPFIREFKVYDLVIPSCAAATELAVPACNASLCDIIDFNVDPGDCHNDSTYSLALNFSILSPAVYDSFDVWANGQFFARYGMSQLPLTIPNFPWNGGAFDVIRVCTKANTASTGCCEELEFLVPDCFDYEDCEVSSLKLKEIKCTSDSTIGLVLDFSVANPSGVNNFTVMANNTTFGPFTLSQLPLTINNFPWNGNVFQKIRVCAGNLPVCCRERTFIAPSCLPFKPCEILEINVIPGPCVNNSTFKATINFQATNPGNGQFTLWGNGQQLGVYPLNAVPLMVSNFPSNGTAGDVVKICINEPTGGGTLSCCKQKEFNGPACGNTAPCEISNLTTLVGDCNPDGTYSLKINFTANNPTNTHFQVWANNGQSLGFFPISQLPVVITNFPKSGSNFDFVKVCIKENPNCCAAKEFLSPNCPPGNCEIFNLAVITGDCNSDGTYKIKVDFDVQNPGNAFFEMWAGNGQYLGIFELNQLPVSLNFPPSGNDFDVIKVCINDHPNCCKVKEFMAPDCNPNNCEIFDVQVLTGICNNDGTYKVAVNFSVQNPTNNEFEMWAGNGQYLGIFPLSQLPVTINNFPASGNVNDVIKICINDNPNCCRIKEFVAPDCDPGDCKIFDLHVLKTPCVCGKFFALLQFEYQEVGNGGFDVMGNGVNYGNFAYNTPQPIIIGPLLGDGTTEYEFVVKDHNHPDCKDDVVLGKVNCSTPVEDLAGINKGQVNIAPNPANNWIQVSAVLPAGKPLGQSTVEVYSADGKLSLNQSVPEGGNFQLDVASLPSGTWRLVILSASGRLETGFVKQ